MTDTGFSGSSDYPFTDPQLARLIQHLTPKVRGITPGSFHHGSAMFRDDAAGWQAHLLGYWVVVHPPTDPKKRAYSYCDEIMPEAPYLRRNRHLVRAVRRMLFAPHWNVEPPAGKRGDGTLSTMNLARRMRKPGIVIRPNGSEYDLLTGEELEV